MKIWLFFSLIFMSCLTWGKSGEFYLAIKNFKTLELPKGRDIYVYLPPGYEENKTLTYPVLYMHDGQNLFDPSRAFLGKTWKARETLNQLILDKKIRPVIVVAIDNTSNRIDEYTHDVDQDGHQGGLARLYLKLITVDLRPIINISFRTKKDRANTGIMGSSLGGLISLYAGIADPAVFGLVGALSPSLWWNRLSILEQYQRAKELPLRIYLDSGTVGGERPQDVIMFKNELSLRYPRSGRVTSHIQTGADHSEIFWAQRFPTALKFLFQ